MTKESRYCLGLLSPQSLREQGWLEEWARDARDFGEELRKGLEDRLIRNVLPSIARGIGEHLESEGIDPGRPENLEHIGEAALTLVFRFMFLLHVEARGYLPVNSPVYSRRSATSLARECHEALTAGPTDKTSTRNWDDLHTLVGMIRKGDNDAGVPAYNGQLFAADGFPGSELLEKAAITNVHLAPALDAIAYDTDRADAPGLDYAGLQVGHLGAIYEALLSMKLSSAPEDLIYDKKRKVYRPAKAGEASEVTRRDLFYQSEKGDRKAGGVFYTRQEFVRHLLKHSLEPALDDHLKAVRETLQRDPDEAARMLFDFSVLDPAMGSAHFLTVALDVMADRYATFLAEVDGISGVAKQLQDLRRDDLPGVRPPEDGELLRRLILKRCIYGVDISPMAVEVANITLWLASFVPGLALSWLDGNLKCGNSLIGVADVRVVSRGDSFMFSDPVKLAMDAATAKHRELAGILDQTPDEVQRSREVAAELTEITSGLRTVFDLWAAEPLGLDGARKLDPTAVLEQRDQLSAANQQAVVRSAVIANDHQFFHWSLEFPSIFHRERPGFDVVVGNPPWKKVRFEKWKFLAILDPGIRGIRAIRERDARAEELYADQPGLHEEMERMEAADKKQRDFYKPANGYVIQGSGDTDLYKLFCERYVSLTRDKGNVGVVLPRVAFLNDGSRGFRRWVFGECTPRRIDFLLNSSFWAFDMEQRYTIALTTLRALAPADIEHAVLRVTGPSRNLDDFTMACAGDGVPIPLSSLVSWTPPPRDDKVDAPGWEVPLVSTKRHRDILGKLMAGTRFDQLQHPSKKKFAKLASGPARLVPYTELHEQAQKPIFNHPPGDGRVPVWKRRCFGQYDPHGGEPAGFADWDTVLDFVHRKRLSGSVFKELFPLAVLQNPATHPINRARIAFHDTARATDSRTISACLVPPKTPLTHKAPFLIANDDWAGLTEAIVLGVLNALSFDWQARRYVETNVTYFILNMLCFPRWRDINWQRIGTLAARLSCVDDRFADFAAEAGVEYGPLTDAQRDDMRAEIDALVAQGYGLDIDELQFIFTDFTLDAVPEKYRELVIAKFEALS